MKNARLRIAQAGRTEALLNHTYDNRVDALLQHLERSGPAKLAPARRWPESRTRLMQLDYFSGTAFYRVPNHSSEESPGTVFGTPRRVQPSSPECGCESSALSRNESVKNCCSQRFPAGKTTSVPMTIYWHSIWSSSKSVEATHFDFRGSLKGCLWLSTKLAPLLADLLTRFIARCGAREGPLPHRWPFAAARAKVTVEFIGIIPRFFRDKV